MGEYPGQVLFCERLPNEPYNIFLTVLDLDKFFWQFMSCQIYT